jgi:hypothetical protein
MAMEYKMIDEVTLKNFKRSLRGIPLREFGPQGAFDSKPSRRGRDEEGGQPSAIAGMIALRDRMSPEGFKALCMSLCDEDGAQDFETPEDRNDSESFPNAKRATAMDAMAFDKLAKPRGTSRADKSFAAMYGDAALSIKTNSDPYPIASRTRT